MDLVRALLFEVDKGGVAGNPFITDETETAQNEMYRFIFNDNEPHTKAQLDAESAFLGAICAEREQAFRMGFKTALELIFSGGGTIKALFIYRLLQGKITLYKGAVIYG
jgi:hypothetical protein